MVRDDLTDADFESASAIDKSMNKQKATSKQKSDEFEDNLEIRIGMRQDKKSLTKVW